MFDRAVDRFPKSRAMEHLSPSLHHSIWLKEGSLPTGFASLRPPVYQGALVAGNQNLGGAIGGFGALGQVGAAGFGGLQGGFPGTNPLFNRYQMGLGGQFGLQGQFGQLGQLGIQGGMPADPNFPQDTAGNAVPGNNKLTFQQLQERRKQISEAREHARRVGSLLTSQEVIDGIASVASAEEIGESFQYNIDELVNLPRQKSAMLPIVNGKVSGSRLSIYNESVHAKFPLLGFKFKNTTGQNLMQGPLAVYEGEAYAGDARIMDLQPDEERLLSYAIDLGTEVKTEMDSAPEELIAVKVVKGIIHASHKLRTTKTYLIRNRSKQERTFIVEHPIRQDWKLMTPEKASEQSRDVYRFELLAPVGKTVKQVVVEESVRPTQMVLGSTDGKGVRVLLLSQVPSAKVKAALQKAMDLKMQQANTRRDLEQLQKQLQAITDDQTRLRANLDKVPPTSAAYKRYLEKFDKQETEIEKLQSQILQQQEAEKKQQKEYEEYLAGLTIE